ncbi:DUF460 domain-containing protein [Candidatus Woesearchaeota archaeon]|nr:DUF460 domain-containing protein [Candidatus Woesearchaeota archaeon]
MENRKLLIVGIDPGATTGYAVLGIEGNLIHLYSSKQLDLNLLISETISHGKVILVGTDKAKVPNLVESFATKLGARVVIPQEDIKVDEKRRMISSFNFGDEHQGDALASALFAYKETKALLDKIDFFAEENKKHGIKDRIKEIVITRRISIKNAASILEEKDEESRIMEKVIVEKKPSENDFLRLYNKLKKYETEIKLIKSHNNNLRKRIINLEKQSKFEEPKISNKPQIDFKENRIRFLENKVKSKEKEAEHLKLLIKKLDKIVSDINNYYILKKLDTLGINEFNFKNNVLNIKANDILLVDNPNIASANVVGLLKNRVFVIVCKKPVGKKTKTELPFLFISAKSLKIEEYPYFGFVEKRHFEIEKGKVNWISKIIDDYKREKEELI